MYTWLFCGTLNFCKNVNILSYVIQFKHVLTVPFFKSWDQLLPGKEYLNALPPLSELKRHLPDIYPRKALEGR